MLLQRNEEWRCELIELMARCYLNRHINSLVTVFKKFVTLGIPKSDVSTRSSVFSNSFLRSTDF